MKRFTVTAGSKSNPITQQVEIPTAEGKMTPAQAREASRIAFGHTTGVTVMDKGGEGYRLNGSKARRVSNDEYGYDF